MPGFKSIDKRKSSSKLSSGTPYYIDPLNSIDSQA
ncbi:hypothetical protein ABIC45_000520 [Mucilaginibacter rubeus]